MTYMKFFKQDRPIVLGILRIAMGWLFFWAFLDKTFGLGFATEPANAWIRGGSPCRGFLLHATQGPCSAFYNWLANFAIVDWMFMLGLLLIGLSLILGVAMRLGVLFGSLMMALMYLAVLPPAHNPIIDEHSIYILILITLLHYHADRVVGLGEWWYGLRVVKKWKWLQ